MDDLCIGSVAQYYGDRRVAILALSDMIHVGDWLHLVGPTTDLVQPVVSLQINHQSVQKAGPGEQAAVRVNDRVHLADVVYRITAEEAKDLKAERMLQSF